MPAYGLRFVGPQAGVADEFRGEAFAAHGGAVDLDEGSEFERALTMHMLIAQGKIEEAVALGSPRPPKWGSFQLLLACAARRPEAEVAALASGVQPSDDPESNYFSAAHLSYCGRSDAARGLLRRAIDGNYCASEALDTDPLMANLRATPEYAAVKNAGRECAARFAAQR